MAFTEFQSYFTNHHGLDIYYRCFLPESTKATILFAHGIGEHSGRYTHLAEFFCSHEISFIALDHQGHGLSEGKRGHVPTFQAFADDMEMLRTQTADIHQRTPLFIMGHSMGGLIAFLYVLKHQDKVNGTILTSPSFRIKMEVPRWKTWLATILYYLAPNLTMRNSIDASLLSRDDAVVEDYRNDPLVHSFISLSLFWDMVHSGQRCMREANRVTIPLFILLGGHDEIIDVDAARKTFDAVNTNDKKILVFQDDYHEILNEYNNERVMQELVHWLEQRFA